MGQFATSSLVPDRVQSSEESSPGQTTNPKKKTTDGKKTSKKDTKKEKKTKSKKYKNNDDDDNDDECVDPDHAALGRGDDPDDDGDSDGLSGYGDLFSEDAATGKKTERGGSKKRPAAAKSGPRKRPSKKNDDDAVTEVWGLPKSVLAIKSKFVFLGWPRRLVGYCCPEGIAVPAHDWGNPCWNPTVWWLLGKAYLGFNYISTFMNGDFCMMSYQWCFFAHFGTGIPMTTRRKITCLMTRTWRGVVANNHVWFPIHSGDAIVWVNINLFVDSDMNQGSMPVMPRNPEMQTLSLAMLPRSLTAPWHHTTPTTSWVFHHTWTLMNHGCTLFMF